MHSRRYFSFLFFTTLLLFSAVFFGLSAGTVGGAYYIAPNGSDSNSGTSESSPFKTIQKAVNLAQPGQTIYLASGIYFQDVITSRGRRCPAFQGTQAPPKAGLLRF